MLVDPSDSPAQRKAQGVYNARVDSTPGGRFERPLRILHLTQHSEAGGLSRYIHDIALAMHGMGHDVRVAGNRGAWHWLFERAPFPYIELPLDKGPIALWNSARALRQYIAAHPMDVIHSHYRRTTLTARRIQRHGWPPILYTLHLSDIPLTWEQRLFSDYGDHVHVASTESRRWVIENAKVPEERVTLIQHGIQIEKFPTADAASRAAARRRFSLADSDRVACFVGRLDVPKNEDWLLDVAERSREAIPNLRILVCGTGPHEPSFLKQVRTRKLWDRVLVVGEFENPLPVYQASDAMLLPSQREGFSLATAEAMSVGLAVCRTRTAGATDLIVEGETGCTTDINREAFVSGAIEFLKDGEGLRRMGAAGPARVAQLFTYDRQLRETVAMYRKLAGRTVNT